MGWRRSGFQETERNSSLTVNRNLLLKIHHNDLHLQNGVRQVPQYVFGGRKRKGKITYLYSNLGKYVIVWKELIKHSICYRLCR